jgi:hypothetical protein
MSTGLRLNVGTDATGARSPVIETALTGSEALLNIRSAIARSTIQEEYSHEHT